MCHLRYSDTVAPPVQRRYFDDPAFGSAAISDVKRQTIIRNLSYAPITACVIGSGQLVAGIVQFTLGVFMLIATAFAYAFTYYGDNLLDYSIELFKNAGERCARGSIGLVPLLGGFILYKYDQKQAANRCHRAEDLTDALTTPHDAPDGDYYPLDG